MIPAFPAVVGILNSRQFKVLFPVGSFFPERCRTVANFDPAGGVIGTKSCIPHVSQVLAFGNRSSAQSLGVDGFQKRLLTAGLDSGADQIPHGKLLRGGLDSQ
jgi:hypothetical protein